MTGMPQAAACRNKKKANRRKAVGKASASPSTSTLPHARDLSVYDGQVCIGIIKVARDGTARAFDPNGKRRGDFASLEAALKGSVPRVTKRRARDAAPVAA